MGVSGAIGLVAVPPVLWPAYGIWKEPQLDKEGCKVIRSAGQAANRDGS